MLKKEDQRGEITRRTCRTQRVLGAVGRGKVFTLTEKGECKGLEDASKRGMILESATFRAARSTERLESGGAGQSGTEEVYRRTGRRRDMDRKAIVWGRPDVILTGVSGERRKGPRLLVRREDRQICGKKGVAVEGRSHRKRGGGLREKLEEGGSPAKRGG